MLRVLGLFLAIVLPIALTTAAVAESRGLTVELRTEEDVAAPVAERIALYGNSYALVIGNDAYSEGWPRLSNAVADAAEVAAALKQAGFEVTLQENVNSETLRASLRQFFAIQGADPEARLLLWYAGHGYSSKGEGFLVPIDAPAPSEPTFKLDALQMRDFGSLMRLADAKHVLAIFDSCFSGTIFTTRAGAVPAAITQVTTRPTRQFITSGDADQQVSDDGTFRRLFLQALAGELTADANGDGYLTGTELGLFMSNGLTNYSEGAQTPRYGKLLDPRYDEGDFVFALPGASTSASAAPTAETGTAPDTDALIAEIALWKAVADSDDPEVIQAYLDTYPTGRFALSAISRMSELYGAIAEKEAAAKAQPLGEADNERPAYSDYPAPTYSMPTYSMPTYSMPTYSAPTYSMPTYSMPTYSAPSGTTVYSEPIDSAPDGAANASAADATTRSQFQTDYDQGFADFMAQFESGASGY